MRSDDPNPNPVGSTLARLRARMEPARRWFSGRDAGPRRALALGAPLALAALVAGAYFVSSEEPLARVLLFDGHRFDHDAVPKVVKVLRTKGIDCRVEKGRVAVPPSRLVEAAGAVEEANLGPRPPLEDDPQVPGIFDNPAVIKDDKARRKLKGLEELVRDVDPAIERAHIEVLRPQARGLAPAAEPKATVVLFGEASRPVPPRAIVAIQRLLVSVVPDLKPEAVTILGHKGVPYLVQGNPALLVESQAQARAEEIKTQILDKLDWIKGVKVSVRIDPATPPATRPPRPVPTPAPTGPIVAPNTPLSLAPEDLPTATVSIPAPAPVEAADASGQVSVLVQVPVTFYLYRPRLGDPDHEVSAADLPAYAEKVDGSIRAAVRHAAPGAKPEDVTISRIDVTGPERPARSFPEARKVDPAWALAAGLALLAALALVGGLRSGRRPSARPQRRKRYDRRLTGEAPGSGPAPSERVRELVRMDPEAAAGVLQRWIGQGEDAS